MRVVEAERGKKVAFSSHVGNLQENILHTQEVRERETWVMLLIVVFMVKRIAGKNMQWLILGSLWSAWKYKRRASA